MRNVRKNDIAVIDNTITRSTSYKQVYELQCPYGTLTSDNKVVATDFPTLATIINSQKARIEELEKNELELKNCIITLSEAINQLNCIIGTNAVDMAQIKRILNDKANN